MANLEEDSAGQVFASSSDTADVPSRWDRLLILRKELSNWKSMYDRVTSGLEI